TAPAWQRSSRSRPQSTGHSAPPRPSPTQPAQRSFPTAGPGEVTASMSSAGDAPRPGRSNARATPLVGPPVALAFDVSARVLAEVGRADDEDLEALRPGL